jgi:hypothetical protein
MFDVAGGVVCVLAVVATMEALRLSTARRRVLWEIGAMGAGVIVAQALGGSESAVLSVIVALAIAGCAAAVCGRFGLDLKPRLTHFQGAIAAAALASTLFGPSDAPFFAVLGAGVALAGVAALARLGRITPNESLHFACAGACAVIGYAAGHEQGVLAVVIVIAMAALIASHLTMALAGTAWPALVSAMKGTAACSVVAAGVVTGSGALLVTGVAAAIGCAASHASATESRGPYLSK